MKKTFFTLALGLGLVGAAQAQSITYGVKAGASLTNLTGDGVSNNSNKFGFHAGVLANFAVNDMFSVQPELLYSMKGAQASNNSDQKVNLNYIDVPVMLKIATGATGLFFELGPQVGFLATAKAKDSNNSLDIKDNFNTVDFGYAAGLGFKTETGPMVGLRYNGGFTNAPKEIIGIQPKAKNSAFQLYVGYTFGGK